jgi:cysteine desulfurase
MNRRIYLDHAATTYLRQEALEAMMPYLGGIYGNPSSIHTFGFEARRALETARAQIAQVLGTKPEEILFTSGGTESDNLAVRGAAQANKGKGRHIITSQIEHPAVLKTCQALEKEGYDVTYLPVDQDGIVDLNALKDALRNDTILVSIMAANNEIGTIQPIEQIGRIIKEKSKAYFHVDAVQAVGVTDMSLDRLTDVDLMSFSAHKFYGPAGIGGLFVRKGTRLSPILTGGSQEKGKRAGTENVAGAVGMAEALRLAAQERELEAARLMELRDYLIERVLGEIPDSRLNGHRHKRLPGNANFSFDYIEGESLVMRMSALGIAGSTGSACSSASLDPSHVLLAIGLKHETAHGSFRVTLGKATTRQDIDDTVEALKGVVKDLRDMSPLCQKG